VTYDNRYWKHCDIFVKEVFTVECIRYNEVAAVRKFSLVLCCMAITNKPLELSVVHFVRQSLMNLVLSSL
jgi:hypothetical protein